MEKPITILILMQGKREKYLPCVCVCVVYTDGRNNFEYHDKLGNLKLENFDAERGREGDASIE